MDGKLELAIAEYEAAYAVEPGADSLFRIAGLYERLGDRAQAAHYLTRYLAAAPAASDRDVVTARIAALAAPTIGSGDGSASRVTSSPQSTGSPARVARPLEYCQCIPTNRNDGTSQLCKAKLAAKCKCQRTDGFDLCPAPFAACSGSGCDFYSSFDGKHHCPVPGFAQFALPGTHGGPCTGYANPDQTTPVDGKLTCDQCLGASAWPYRGHAGDRCTGFHSSDGRPVAGELDNCRAAIPPGYAKP
jgi:hypothetical protein